MGDKRVLLGDNTGSSNEENEVINNETNGQSSRDNGEDNGTTKKLKLGDGDIAEHKIESKGKGKMKVDEVSNEAEKQICAICFYEGKRRLRGTLDCCDHYFCFTCIKKWSRIESRCPLCKQRINTISKLTRSKSSSEPKTVVIQVRERDQEPEPMDDEEEEEEEPNEELLEIDLGDHLLWNLCIECHHSGVSNHMLCCKNCGFWAHTYCVGLGNENFEGDWYCSTCRKVVNGDPSSLGQGNSSRAEYRVSFPPLHLPSLQGLGNATSTRIPAEYPLTSPGTWAPPSFSTLSRPVEQVERVNSFMRGLPGSFHSLLSRSTYPIIRLPLEENSLTTRTWGSPILPTIPFSLDQGASSSSSFPPHYSSSFQGSEANASTGTSAQENSPESTETPEPTIREYRFL